MNYRVAALILLLLGAGIHHFVTDGEASLRVSRSVQHRRLIPGETIEVTWELSENAAGDLTYVMIEEVPANVRVISVEGGSYNETAGVIIWRGSLDQGRKAIGSYVIRLGQTDGKLITLYGYASTDGGAVAHSLVEIEPILIPITTTVDRSLLQPEEVAMIDLVIKNPLNRQIDVTLRSEIDPGLTLTNHMPQSVSLAPGEAIRVEFGVVPKRTGTYSLSVTPYIDNVPAGHPGHATLTVYQERRGFSSPGLREVPRRDEEGSVSRSSVMILSPRSETVFTDMDRTNIEIRGPTASTLALYVNDEEVGDDRIGAVGTDRLYGGVAKSYISIPLREGKNKIMAVAVTDENDETTHTITVYRSGSPANISIRPITELTTGRILPLKFRVSATDRQGLPPENGTPITIRVVGGRVVSQDARPDWIGHHLELHDGESYFLVEAPVHPTELVIEAKTGRVEAIKRFQVNARAEQWTVLGHGSLAVDRMGSVSDTPPWLETRFRGIARGPVFRDGVLTIAINRDDRNADGSRRNNRTIRTERMSEIWTGDTSEQGMTASPEDPLFVRLEKAMSHSVYGRSHVRFAGELSRYDRNQRGFHFVWNVAQAWNVTGFYGKRSIDMTEEVFDGDGTGYFRLKGRYIEPFSEDVTIVLRERRFPHDVVRMTRLDRSRYYIDDVNGQIILAEPLPSTDEVGNPVTLRVRYRLRTEDAKIDVGGLQAAYDTGRFLVRGTVFNRLNDAGETSLLMAVGAESNINDFSVALESARQFAGTEEAQGVSVSVRNPNLYGWDLALKHRNISPGLLGDYADFDPGMMTSIQGERSFDRNAKLVVGTSYLKKYGQSPWVRETSFSTQFAWKKVRPKIAFTSIIDESQSAALSVRAGMSGYNGLGGFSYSHERPLIGDVPIQNRFQANVEFSRRHMLTFTVNTAKQNPDSSVVSEVGLGLTHAFEQERWTTNINSGYTMDQGTDLSQGSYVIGSKSEYIVNERNDVKFTLDYRRPLLPSVPSGFGSAIGWTYRHKKGGESEWRFDFRREGDAIKRVLQWRGLHPVNDALTFRGDALVSVDGTGDKVSKLRVGVAHRTPRSIFIFGIDSDRFKNSTLGLKKNEGLTVEWKLQGARKISPRLFVTGAYAQRSVDPGSSTGKSIIGVTYRPADRLELLLEASLLDQHDTNTARAGGMIGVGYELFEHFWLTIGYGTSQFVRRDTSGDRFSRREAGVSVQMDWSFDEWSLKRLFTSK